MCDFLDDFDEFGENGFMNDDSFEDSPEGALDEPFADEPDHDGEPDDAESQGDDLTVDPFFIGGAMGFAYEAGVEERRRKRLLKEQSNRRKRKRFSDDSD